MTPFSFEWQWNVDYFIFMGLLYVALAVIACGLLYTLLKSWMDLSSENKAPDHEAPAEISYRTRYPEY